MEFSHIGVAQVLPRHMLSLRPAQDPRAAEKDHEGVERIPNGGTGRSLAIVQPSR